MKKGKSLWVDTTTLPSFPTLEENLKTDVVIIGGGLCGILCAYYLQQVGKKVIVLEKNKIGMGITKNTTAVITAQHDVLYAKRIKKDGFAKAKQYLEANLLAVEEYRKLSKRFNFDFEEKDSYLYSTKDITPLEEEVKALQALGVDAKLVDEIPLPFMIKKALKFPRQAQMNALKLINQLAKELSIYEHTNVINIKQNKVYTDKHFIETSHIIVTTHYPFLKRWGMYPVKLFQRRSYVVAIKNSNNIKGTYTNLEKAGFYFRNYQDYLLIGGNDEKTGVYQKQYENLVAFCQKYYPNNPIAYMWANQDCVTLDDTPYIGLYSHFNKHIYVATGFNLWGMTQSMISAMLLKDFITKQKNKYQSLYRPHRPIINKKLFLHMKSFFKNVVKPLKPRCTHLGCSLVWNEVEETWDCPCHGSRFTKEGKVIDNPATKNLYF